MKIAAVDLDPVSLPEMLTSLRLCGLIVSGTMESPHRGTVPCCRLIISGDALPFRCEREFLLVRLISTQRPGNYSLTAEIIGPVESKTVAA